MVGIGPLIKTGPSTAFYAYADVIEQSISGNWSKIRLRVEAYNGPAGSTASFYGGSGGQSCSIDALGISAGHYASSNFLPSGYAQNQLRWSDYVDHIVYHDSNGYLGGTTNHSVRMGIAYAGINENYYATLSVPRIPRVPAKPVNGTVSNVKTTSLRLNGSAPDNKGSSIVEYQFVATPIGAPIGTPTVTSNNSGAVHDIPGLVPGVQYKLQYRARNGVGWGPFSDGVNGTTLASAYVGKGGAFVSAAAVNVGKAGAFVAVAEVRVGKGGSFVSAG